MILTNQCIADGRQQSCGWNLIEVHASANVPLVRLPAGVLAGRLGGGGCRVEEPHKETALLVTWELRKVVLFIQEL